MNRSVEFPLSGSFGALPSPPLRDFVSHYWLCRDAGSTTHAILPDGAVDVVVALGSGTQRVEVFGTTTARTDVAVERGGHTLGIRFRPGQSRHFVDVPAAELVDACLPAVEVSRLKLDGVVDTLARGDAFAWVDAALLRHLDRHPPRRLSIDAVVRHLEGDIDSVRIAGLAQACGISLRQFERRFIDTVGLPPKLFAEITRFQQAAWWLARSTFPLSRIATGLGYADQSHMTRAFARFAGQPPARARRDVAFIQDATRPPDNAADSFNHTMGRPK